MAQKPKRQVKLNHLSQSRNGQITGAFFCLTADRG